MKHYTLLLALFLLGYVNSIAQSKFGNATKEELEMTAYAEDTTASAVVLNKDGLLRFRFEEKKGFQFEYTERVKIKILKTDGLSYANQEIDYYVQNSSSEEKIEQLSGTTYNLENGKVVKTKMTRSNIFEEDTEKKWKKRKFTMPAAKVGSVIEYKYTLISPFFYELRDFVFQSSIPIVNIGYEATIPEYFKYNLNTQGYIVLDKVEQKPVNENFPMAFEDSKGRIIRENHQCVAERYEFKGTNIPAAKSESYLWSIKDYISKATFELRSINIPGGYYKEFSSSWSHIDEELFASNSFGGNLKRSGWFKDEIEKVDTPTLEKALEIKKVVKNKMQWNNENSMYSDKLKNALDKGIGSSADINFLLINALTAGGFDAFPVILSTRSNGRIPITHPSVSAFNYLITGVRIDTVYYFTDASDKFSSWNILPQKCMVNQARILKNNHKDWINLNTMSGGGVVRQANVKFADNHSEMKVIEMRIGNDAYNARKHISSFENQDKFLESIQERNNCIIEDFSITDLDDNFKPYKTEYIEKKDIDLGSEYLYFAPPLSKLFSENPFKLEKRTYPINFDYFQNYIQNIIMEIPEGYEVAELPKQERIITPGSTLSFIYSIRQDNNALTLNSRIQIKQLLFLPTDYEMLKEFFAKIILKTNENIVFKKKTAETNQLNLKEHDTSQKEI